MRGGIKRVIRYLAGAPSCKWIFKYQNEPNCVTLQTDSDWAGCVVTRRSTSGGAIYLGDHLIHHWSKLQGPVALSSGEAELGAQVKGIAEALGIRNAVRSLGVHVGVSSFVDSSASKGIVSRVGVGKIKHLEVKHLWVQAFVRDGSVQVFKIPRKINTADLLTHSCTSAELYNHLSRMGLKVSF